MKHPRWLTLFTALLRGCLFFLLSAHAVSQRADNSIAIYGSFNDDGQIFLYPQSPDPMLRQQTKSIGGAYGISAAWRYRLFPTVALDVRGEYVSLEEEQLDPVATEFTHGFHVVLIQGSALFSLPFSSERFEMYVGGGVGVYGGSRVYSVAGIEAEHVSAAPAIGIHVLVGAEFLITAGFGVRFETLFRDPQMGVENRFPQSSVVSHGVTYHLQTETFRSNINLNGNVYSLGLCCYF
ncbi:MAG: hypothetical protein WC824_05330 [Bacteroidota bacterium]|jgi:hypothetical protein